MTDGQQKDMMQFRNRLCILRSIDSFELPNSWSGNGSEVARFLSDPYHFYIQTTDAKRRGIFEALLKRENRPK